LRPIRAGRASPEDRAAARWNRAAAFQLLGQIDDDVFVDEAAKTLRFRKHKFWRGVSNMTLAEVIHEAAHTPNDPASASKANSDDPPPGPSPELASASGTGTEVPDAPSADYETLDDNICMEHFGISWMAPTNLVPRVLAVRPILVEKVGSTDIGAWINAGYAANLNSRTLFNIAKIQEMVDDAKRQFAEAEADGFRVAEPAEYGAANHSDAHARMLKALDLRNVVDGLKPLKEGGYLRIIGGTRMYHIEKMRELMERGRAMPVPPDPIDPPQ
jgi:hypothetical protein